MKEEKTWRDPSLWPHLTWKFLWSFQLESLLSLLGGLCLHFPENTGLCSINVDVTIFSTHLPSALDMSWSPNSTRYHSSLVHPDNWTDDQAKCLVLILFVCVIFNSTDISFKECFWIYAALTNPKRLLMSLMTQRKTKGSLVRLTESFGSYLSVIIDTCAETGTGKANQRKRPVGLAKQMGLSKLPHPLLLAKYLLKLNHISPTFLPPT